MSIPGDGRCYATSLSLLKTVPTDCAAHNTELCSTHQPCSVALASTCCDAPQTNSVMEWAISGTPCPHLSA